VLIDFKKASRKIIFNGGFNYVEKPNFVPGPKYAIKSKNGVKVAFPKS
jgi:hypothetical protein